MDKSFKICYLSMKTICFMDKSQNYIDGNSSSRTARSIRKILLSC